MKIKIKILRPLISCLLALSTAAGLLRADPSSPVGYGYTPQQLWHAFGVDQLKTTGQGQIIAVIAPNGPSTIQADMDTFSAAFNIPSTTVRVYYPEGQPGTNTAWASETTGDAESAHAMAPGATIAFVVAKSTNQDDMYAAIDYAVSLGAKQVTMSWAIPEYSTETSDDFHFNVPGVSFFASAGDWPGYYFPACSPYVVGVGGVTLDIDSIGNIISETGWSDGPTAVSGGGPSFYEPIPSYQVGWVNGTQRGFPDVALNADTASGLPTYLTGSGWRTGGGCSQSTPLWAGLCALANSLRSESIQSAPVALYACATANYAGYFHDITSGIGANGYSAGPGYDFVTGLGTPIANQLIPALAGGFASQVAAPVFFSPAGVYASTQNVTIVSATPSAFIRYTTDGSMPTETYGTLYSGPVSIGAATTLTAIAYEGGLTDSPVTGGSYTFLPQVATPAFSPPAGAYASAQSVTISTATSGASIRYTTDGSLPTETSGILYSGPISISANTTLITAIAYESGFIDSPVTSGYAFYVVTPVNVLYNFTVSNNNGNEAGSPATLIQGSDGNFYGTTDEGGSANEGTVFKLTPAGVLTTLHSFNGTDGESPEAALVQGSDGNFYGTTAYGSGDGTVFKMTPAGVITTLVSFNGLNGANPEAGLVQGSDGNFYGTTAYGGGYNDGTVFQLTPAGVLTTLHSFNGADGESPEAALVQGRDGNFYGTTDEGGSTYVAGSNAGDGTVFKVTLTPTPTLTTLVSFTGTTGTGEFPETALVQGGDGNFYGTTTGDGMYENNSNGTVFKVTLTPTPTLTTLYAFPYFDFNGAHPETALLQGSDGNFYGTTAGSGNGEVNSSGTFFKMTPAGVLTTLASFEGPNGAQPESSLIRGNDGNFYGTTVTGGTYDYGVIYQLKQAAAPVLSPAAGTYTGTQTVTITSSTSGASIRYTTDGSTPTETNGTIYSGPVSISATTTLQAIAYETGDTDSTVTPGVYTISTGGITVSSSTGFYNTAVSSSQAGTFTATFNASPSLSPSNATIALCKGTQTAYTGLSCIARFNTSGYIDAYNGTTGIVNYQAASVIPYSKALTYHFRLVVNVPANTYSVYVTPPGGSEVLVGLNYGFRKAATSLDTWNIDVNATPGGSVTVGNLSISGSGGTVAAPTFSPVSGTYTSAQMVTISTATSGASIRYTTDGSTPSETTGTLYAGPVSISATATLNAIAYETGFTDSTVTPGLYTIGTPPPQVAAPTFSPAAGTYTSVQTVTISTATSGASIRYTINGGTLSETSGTPYTGPVSIGITGTLNAIAYKTGFTDSPVIPISYTIVLPKVDTPTFSTGTGTYTSEQTVTISTATSGATIFYTTDGLTPTKNASSQGTIYSGPILISKTTTLNVIAYKTDMADSLVATEVYTIQNYSSPQVTAPAFSPAAGTYASAQTVTISTTTGGASIRYTTDGATPSEITGTLYTGPVSIGSTGTLQAIAYETGDADSTVTTGFYTINAPQVAAPAFSPAAGTYATAQTVTISTATSGASIRYTIDGSTPSETVGTLYAGPVSISSTTVLKAMAYETGVYSDSAVTAGIYTITSAPAFALNVIYNLLGSNNGGSDPLAGLVQGSDGNLYGTIADGGSTNDGTVFKLTQSGVLTTLVSFTGQNGADLGANPEAGLVQGSDGNFYGTTEQGGGANDGTVFKLTQSGVLTTLVSFTGQYGADLGTNPKAGLVQGTDGNFYGATEFGGTYNYGTLFKLTPAGVLTPVFSFNGTTSGGLPLAALVQSSDGNFYGTTAGDGGRQDGDIYPDGTVFKVTPAGNLTTLVSFNGSSAKPNAGLVQGSDGNFYGTTQYGDPNGDGTAFKLTPTGVLTTLATFNDPNGAYPEAGLVQGRDGNFYGTTGSGGGDNEGTVFKLTPAGVLTTLVSFNGPNGANPKAGLVQGSDGNLYGTTSQGGMANDGVVFQVIVPPPVVAPPVVAPTFSPAAGTYTNAQTVTISTTTSGASIRYTTDDSTPSETAGTIYSGSISISATTTLKAIAYKSGYTDSTVNSGLYTINTLPPPQVVAPAFSPAAGTYTSAQTVNISTKTSGASIRYTIDNSMPSETAGTIYSGPVSISATTMLKAIAYESGYTDSTVTSGLYTINVATRSLTGTSSNGFHALALTASQTGTFTATFDATSTVSPENAVVGLSKGVATAYTGLSCIARFNTSGDIDAYNGTAYQAASTISYTKNTVYHFRMVVNVTAHTYSVYVTPAGGSELTVGLNYVFRVAQSSLDTWDLDVNATPSGCSLTANNLYP